MLRSRRFTRNGASSGHTAHAAKTSAARQCNQHGFQLIIRVMRGKNAGGAALKRHGCQCFVAGSPRPIGQSGTRAQIKTSSQYPYTKPRTHHRNAMAIKC